VRSSVDLEDGDVLVQAFRRGVQEGLSLGALHSLQKARGMSERGRDWDSFSLPVCSLILESLDSDGNAPATPELEKRCQAHESVTFFSSPGHWSRRTTRSPDLSPSWDDD